MAVTSRLSSIVIIIEETSTTKLTETTIEESPSTASAEKITELSPPTEFIGTNTAEAMETSSKQATMAGTLTNAATQGDVKSSISEKTKVCCPIRALSIYCKASPPKQGNFEDVYVLRALFNHQQRLQPRRQAPCEHQHQLQHRRQSLSQ
ncbi:unnamed protein product, partial [Didymodactylos carnosus]